MQQPGIDILWIKQRKNRFSGLVSVHEQKLGSKNKEPRESDISPTCWDAPH